MLLCGCKKEARSGGKAAAFHSCPTAILYVYVTSFPGFFTFHALSGLRTSLYPQVKPGNEATLHQELMSDRRTLTYVMRVVASKINHTAQALKKTTKYGTYCEAVWCSRNVYNVNRSGTVYFSIGRTYTCTLLRRLMSSYL